VGGGVADTHKTMQQNEGKVCISWVKFKMNDGYRVAQPILRLLSALRQSSPFNPAYAQAEGAARGLKSTPCDHHRHSDESRNPVSFEQLKTKVTGFRVKHGMTGSGL
jgi:hypothetical protein